MSTLLEKPEILEVAEELAAWERNRDEVLAANRAASAIEAESLAAFLDLLYGADTAYLGDETYAEALPEPEPALPPLDWQAVSLALAESQQILIGVQHLLSETLAAMGIEDHAFIRVYADPQGLLRLVSDHPRREEIELVLNSPENQDLRTLHAAAAAGMGLAGGLVGTVAVPDGVLERLKADTHAA